LQLFGFSGGILERATGIEPVTSSLGNLFIAKNAAEKRSGFVPTSDNNGYHSVTSPFSKLRDFARVHYSVSLVVFAFSGSCRRFASKTE
jgi:hypothetical protein